MEANWKVYAENYQEGYHIPLVHPGLHRQIDSSRYEVEVDGPVTVHRAPTRDGAVTEGAWLWRFPGLALNLYPSGLCLESYWPLGPDHHPGGVHVLLRSGYTGRRGRRVRGQLGGHPRRGPGHLRGGPAQPGVRPRPPGRAEPAPRVRGGARPVAGGRSPRWGLTTCSSCSPAPPTTRSPTELSRPGVEWLVMEPDGQPDRTRRGGRGVGRGPSRGGVGNLGPVPVRRPGGRLLPVPGRLPVAAVVPVARRRLRQRAVPAHGR